MRPSIIIGFLAFVAIPLSQSREMSKNAGRRIQGRLEDEASKAEVRNLCG